MLVLGAVHVQLEHACNELEDHSHCVKEVQEGVLDLGLELIAPPQHVGQLLEHLPARVEEGEEHTRFRHPPILATPHVKEGVHDSAPGRTLSHSDLNGYLG